MKQFVCAVIIASLILLAGTASAQQYGTSPQYAVSPQAVPQPAAQPAIQQGMQQQQQQPPTQQPQATPGVLNIPPAPAKPVANGSYGNTERAAILGEELSNASQGNAKVFIAENSNKTVFIDVHLLTNADPYSLSGTMANLTYMVSNIYSYTEMKGGDIMLTVYDPAGTVITNAKFSDAKNAFEYYNVPQQPATAPSTGGQPATGQPATGQPVTGQPATSQPAVTQPGVGQPSTGQPTFGQPSGMQPSTGFR